MNTNLTSTAMIVNLSISQWTARKYDKNVSKKVEDEYNAHDAGRYNKILVAKEAIKEIQKVANEARTFHYTNTLPWSENGDRILTAANYFTYTEGLREKHDKFDAVVSKFLSAYPSLKEDAKIRLNGMFNELDYPNLEDLKYKFNFMVHVEPIPDSGDFRVGLKDSEVEKIKEEINDRREELEKKAMRDLWERTYSAVKHMVDRLSNEDAVFRNSLIGNIAELVELLPKLNIGNDKKLMEMTREIENKLLGVDADVLREDKGTRREICGNA